MLLIGCFRRLLVFALLLALIGVGWYFRAEIGEGVGRLVGGSDPAEPSPELADAAHGKLISLSEEGSEPVVLSEAELQSLLRYRYREFLPAFVDSPHVRISDGRIRLSARVPTEELGRLPSIGGAQAFLPDTTDIDLVAQMHPLDSGRVALGVDQVTAARIPVPARMIPSILDRLGRSEEPGLAPDAVAVRLPAGAVTAYLRGSELIILRSGTAPVGARRPD